MNETSAQILDAALEKFSAYGVARTSMADIAVGAGLSRPALYQYFENKEDILRGVLERVLHQATTAALDSLGHHDGLGVQLDGFLQRYFGDLAQQLQDTEHGSDLMEAKAGYAMSVVVANEKRLRRGLTKHVKDAAGPAVDSKTVTGWVDLLLLSPPGLRYDQPSMAKYRRRLTALAETLAKAI